jgi:long-chain acyl-CoA synthetase
VRPDANLELDLGLDSMERVELLTELEQRFGLKVPDAVTHEIFTVRQLVEAVRPAGDATGGASVEEAWAALLGDLPPDTDPVLGRLLAPRRIASPLLWVGFRILGRLIARVDVSGLDYLPAKGPYLICPNHQSYLDPFLLCSVLPFRTFDRMFVVGAAEYFTSPLMAWLARQINLVPVDADASLVPAMKAGAFGLTHGRVLLLFPEGERSIDGSVKRFKKGAPILARHVGVPMVPVALKGVFEIWPRNRPINRSLIRPWSPHRVRIALGPPMAVADGDTYAETATRLRAAVDALWQGL